MVMRQPWPPQQQLPASEHEKRQNCGMRMERPMMMGAMNSKAWEAHHQTCRRTEIRMKVQN
jgi:hypothetical protein